MNTSHAHTHTRQLNLWFEFKFLTKFNFRLICALVFLLFLSFNETNDLVTKELELRSNCTKSMDGCETYSGNVTVNFEGCPLRYNLQYGVCLDGTIRVFEPTWVIDNPKSPTCRALQNKISALYSFEEGNGRGSEFINSINVYVANHARQFILNSLINNVQAPHFNCNGRMRLLNFVGLDCLRYCPVYIEDPEQGLLLSHLQLENCGIACCIKSTEFCLEFSTNPTTIIYGDTFTIT